MDGIVVGGQDVSINNIKVNGYKKTIKNMTH